MRATETLPMRFGGDPLTVEEALHPENSHHKDWRGEELTVKSQLARNGYSKPGGTPTAAYDTKHAW
jgi:hypothetical protein